MHELSIAQDIISIVEENVNKADASKVYELELEVGQFSGVMEDALEFALDSIVKGTILDGAKRIIIKVPAIAVCESCNTDFSPEFEYTPCPSCGNFGFKILQGNELRIKSLKVD